MSSPKKPADLDSSQNSMTLQNKVDSAIKKMLKFQPENTDATKSRRGPGRPPKQGNDSGVSTNECSLNNDHLIDTLKSIIFACFEQLEISIDFKFNNLERILNEQNKRLQRLEDS